MSTYAELKPAFEDQLVAEVVMRFRHIDVLPVVNRIGDCVGAVYTADCTEVSRFVSQLCFNSRYRSARRRAFPSPVT